MDWIIPPSRADPVHDDIGRGAVSPGDVVREVEVAVDGADVADHGLHHVVAQAVTAMLVGSTMHTKLGRFLYEVIPRTVSYTFSECIISI